MKIIKTLAILILVIGVVGIAVGSIFVGEGFAKNKLIVDRMNVEKVTLAVDPNDPTAVTQINNASEAQAAADTIAGHRRTIAPTYQDLLGGKQFDPTNPKQLTYVQAMNLENYLYTAVTAFGLIDVTLASGAFMIITGIALLFIGWIILRMAKMNEKNLKPA
jgi:hypothetical protein